MITIEQLENDIDVRRALHIEQQIDDFIRYNYEALKTSKTLVALSSVDSQDRKMVKYITEKYKDFSFTLTGDEDQPFAILVQLKPAEKETPTRNAEKTKLSRIPKDQN
jgi:hypothetical protein